VFFLLKERDSYSKTPDQFDKRVIFVQGFFKVGPGNVVEWFPLRIDVALINPRFPYMLEQYALNRGDLGLPG